MLSRFATQLRSISNPSCLFHSFLIYPSLLIVFVVVTIIVQFKLNPKWRDVEDYKLLEKDFDKPLDLPDFKLASDEDDECAEEKDDKNDNSDKIKKPYTNI